MHALTPYTFLSSHRAGKTTFLDLVAKGEAEGVKLNDGARIGYYRQDFSNLDFNATALDCLEKASRGRHTPQELRGAAGRSLTSRELFSSCRTTVISCRRSE